MKIWNQIIIPVLFLLFLTECNSVSSSKSQDNDNKVNNWYNKHEWLNGLKLIPNQSINREEFFIQYHKNKSYWDEAFNFLKMQDLKNLKAGTYIIDTGNVIATISSLIPMDEEKVNFEAHRNFNDLQYIIAGTAEMGIAPITDTFAKVKVPYLDSTDTEVFTISNGEKYFKANPNEFFIFSPKEIHRPAFKISNNNSPTKKIVIKVRVP